MGTYGRSGASRFLIGSVAESVLRRVQCSVLVVPNAAVELPTEEESTWAALATL
jgi:hypothetical protein